MLSAAFRFRQPSSTEISYRLFSSYADTICCADLQSTLLHLCRHLLAKQVFERINKLTELQGLLL